MYAAPSARNRNAVRPDPTLRVTARRSLRCADGLSLPADIDWLNLRASGDIIAHGGLASLAPAIQDEVVNNGIAEPHTASRYLSQQTLVDTVTKAASL